MSKYVSAEWLIKESMPLSFSVQKWVNEVQIMTAPSIDICFCRECRKWHNGWCYKHGRGFEPNDFCSYGCNLSEFPTGLERSSE